MAAEKKFGSVKRFGPRYGRRLKNKVADVEKKSKKLGKCPYCKKMAAKRLSVGIWECKKCNSKFTGNAYYLEEKIKSTAIEQEEKEVVFKSKSSNEV